MIPYAIRIKMIIISEIINVSILIILAMVGNFFLRTKSVFSSKYTAVDSKSFFSFCFSNDLALMILSFLN